MRIVTISMYGTRSSLQYTQDELGDAAYNKVKEAMEQYRPYKNDKEEVVSIQLMDGGSASFKVEHIRAITIDTGFSEELCRLRAAEEAKMREIRKEFGLPEESK